MSDTKCPKCGGEVEFGYGLAGGGIGPYRFCTSDHCDFFDKKRAPVIDTKPSPYCSVYLTRKQTEELWRLLHQQPQKKWEPHRRALLRSLRHNAGNKNYPENP